MKDNNSMVYAPIILPTLCRYDHFVRCVESLRRNKWAKYTEVFIGLDYPAKQGHWDGYEKIKAYLMGEFSEFKRFRVYYREKNVGATKNTILLRDACAREYDRYIYLEDDLEVSPNFLQYMDTVLQKYKADPDVVYVLGYSYPLPWVVEHGCTVVKQNFNCSAWGYGTWIAKDNWLKQYLKHNGLAKDFSSAYRTNKFDQMIDYAVKDYVTICANGWCGKNGYLNRTTDVSRRISLPVKGKYAIMPIRSKVRNHGYDGSGINCQRIEGVSGGECCVDQYKFSSQPIDMEPEFDLLEDSGFDISHNRALLNSFDRVLPEEMDEIWNTAERVAQRGRYGGAIIAAKKLIQKIVGI